MWTRHAAKFHAITNETAEQENKVWVLEMLETLVKHLGADGSQWKSEI